MRRILPLVAGLVFLAACSSGSVRRGAPAPAVEGPPVRMVVLGSSEAYGADLPRDTRNRLSFGQLVFRNALPVRATYVNIASPDATAADVLSHQVPIAVSLHPTIAIVWVTGDAAAATASSCVRRRRVALAALRTSCVGRVLAIVGRGSPTFQEANDQRGVDVPRGGRQRHWSCRPVGRRRHQRVATAITTTLGAIRWGPTIRRSDRPATPVRATRLEARAEHIRRPPTLGRSTATTRSSFSRSPSRRRPPLRSHAPVGAAPAARPARHFGGRTPRLGRRPCTGRRSPWRSAAAPRGPRSA